MADEDDEGSRRGPMIALIVVVLLVVGGIWLARHMRATTTVEDCMMAGRTNCARLNTGN